MHETGANICNSGKNMQLPYRSARIWAYAAVASTVSPLGYLYYFSLILILEDATQGENIGITATFIGALWDFINIGKPFN